MLLVPDKEMWEVLSRFHVVLRDALSLSATGGRKIRVVYCGEGN
jgi:hypothetical protein